MKIELTGAIVECHSRENGVDGTYSFRLKFFEPSGTANYFLSIGEVWPLATREQYKEAVAAMESKELLRITIETIPPKETT
jgi:hypothetical protein